MKKGIHPERHLVTVHCACGMSFQTHSTEEDIRLTICSLCHPFFTGEQKFVDTAGRVERFQNRYNKVTPAATSKKPTAKASAKKA